MTKDYIELEGRGGGRRLIDVSSIVAVVESVSTEARRATTKVVLENGEWVAISEESFSRLRRRLIQEGGRG